MAVIGVRDIETGALLQQIGDTILQTPFKGIVGWATSLLNNRQLSSIVSNNNERCCVFIHIFNTVTIHNYMDLKPGYFSNNAFYRKCSCNPLSLSAIKARWRLFGYVLRMSREAPAQLTIDEYFTHDATG